eukprot:990722-Pyramimonas_sp.AAC.1
MAGLQGFQGRCDRSFHAEPGDPTRPPRDACQGARRRPGVSNVAAMRLRKAVHGLVEAAIEWFMTVSEALEEFGWAQMRMDLCAWALRGDAHGQGDRFAGEALQDFLGPEKLDMLVAAKGDLDVVAAAGSR